MSFTDPQVQQHMAEAAGKIMTATGAGASVGFGLTSTEWQAVGVVAGIVIGLIGVGVQIWFASKR